MSHQEDLFGPVDKPTSLRPVERVVPLGKYKSQPYEILLTDADYAIWMLNSMHAKLQHHYPELLAFLIGRFGIPDSTPAHNKLQNRFLDDTFAIKFAMACNTRVQESLCMPPIDLPQVWERYVRWLAEHELERVKKCQRWEQPSQLDALKACLLEATPYLYFSASTGTFDGAYWRNPAVVSKLEFEHQGADVAFAVRWSGGVHTKHALPYPERDHVELHSVVGYGSQESFRVEVKPLVGDDYPAILRAMKAVKSRQLLVDEYFGAGATWEQMVSVFGKSSITAVRLSDVERIEVPDAVEVRPITQAQAVEAVERVYAELTRAGE